MDTQAPKHSKTRSRRSRQPQQSRGKQSAGSDQRFWTDKRAQTSIDLLFAVLVFFSAVALVTVQSPGLFFPQDFSDSDTGTTADRIAQELVKTELTEPGTTGISHASTTSFLATGNVSSLFDVRDDRVVRVRVIAPQTDRGPPRALDPEFDDTQPYTVQNNSNTYYVRKGPAGSPSERSIVHLPATLDDRPVTIEVAVWNPNP